MARRGTHMGPEGPSLFEAAARRDVRGAQAMPLAERVRPATLDDIVGQQHLVGEGCALRRAIAADRLPSMILWGPPGTGKTTLATVLAGITEARFVPFSAVLGGVADVRKIVAEAEQIRRGSGRRTVLFVDEIHRFNKSQQDAFLPHVERGTVVLVGATTENPSFALNAPLLSRCVVYRLESIPDDEVERLLRRALDHPRGYDRQTDVEPEALALIAQSARGDGRRALGLLEVAVEQARLADEATLTVARVEALSAEAPLLYDKAGDEHYAVVSAFIKSMRGSDPDAAIYWMMRMVDSGDDPLFVLRRMIIFASEDVGVADPRALTVAVSADQAFRRLGLPEGIYPMAQAAIYLACAPKSNAANVAWHRARQAIRERGALPVPKKLRPASTRLNKAMGHGEGYRYPHDEGGFAVGETYLPQQLVGQRFYEPTDRGLERQISEWLERTRHKGD